MGATQVAVACDVYLVEKRLAHLLFGTPEPIPRCFIQALLLCLSRQTADIDKLNISKALYNNLVLLNKIPKIGIRCD